MHSALRLCELSSFRLMHAALLMLENGCFLRINSTACSFYSKLAQVGQSPLQAVGGSKAQKVFFGPSHKKMESLHRNPESRAWTLRGSQADLYLKANG